MPAFSLSPTDRTERRQIILAGAFLFVYSLALTLSDAARLRTWQVDYRWSQWLSLLIWMGVIWLIHRQLARYLPERDPYLFPMASLLTGWGLLTISRLSASLGLRQAAWLVVIGILLWLAIRFDQSHKDGLILSYLRRFKYVWLTCGLLLTAVTLILGTNPLGSGPRLWLGCCGLYFQPSEPLKLLLIVYLAAYLADRQADTAPRSKILPLLTPTLIMTGVALLLLIFQRDLGTAALFLILYAVIVYSGTRDKRVLILSLLALAIAATAGYALFEVVSQRVDAWINPWLDPAGHSYQIVQSLLAVANGGLLGRGPGMGSPGLVPIAQSDFIFSAISEEAGLVGAFGILVLLGLIVNRGMRLTLKSSDTFLRLLSIGLVLHLVGQSILIMAGNLRLFPLTGVTLPFVSYGGSSLLVSFVELLCLLLISARPSEAFVLQPERLKAESRTSMMVSGTLLLGLAGTAVAAGWWGVVRGPDLLARTDNPRRSIADRYVRRGAILDREGGALAESSGQPGEIVRSYPYPQLGPLVGYTDPVYGQAGLEASLDSYLRGLKGYPALTLWWQHMLYGQPPAGLDVRLSLDLDLQSKADDLLAGKKGALVLLNAQTGEVLAMASSPTFDANTLGASWESLINDPDAPLFDRATMGLYPAGNALGVFLLADSSQTATGLIQGVNTGDCALAPVGNNFGEAISAGCTEATRQLLAENDSQALMALVNKLGFYTAPAFPVETLSSPKPDNIENTLTYLSGNETDPSASILKVSPLQMALAVAALTNGGERPAARLALAVNTPQAGWVMLPVNGQAEQALQPQAAAGTIQAMASEDLPIWQLTASDRQGEGYAWYLGGTLPSWKGVPLAMAVLLEEPNPQKVNEIGHAMLQDAVAP